MKRTLFRTIFPVLLLILLFLQPQAAMQGVTDGTRLWAHTVLPALLPFYAATQLLQQCGGLALLTPLMRPFCRLMRLPDSLGSIVFAGWLSGAPNGARLLAQVCNDQEICTRVCACFTVTSPLFLIGTANRFLGSPLYGILIYTIHFVAALCTGLLWRSRSAAPSNSSIPAGFDTSSAVLSALPEALRDSSMSLLLIGGAIAFFAALTSALQAAGMMSALEAILHAALPADAVSALTAGFFEVSQGTYTAANSRLSLPLRLSLICAFASFGGVSVLCQAKMFLRDRVRTSAYFLQRAVHAALSFILSRFFFFFFGSTVSVSASLSAPDLSSADVSFSWSLPILCVLFSLFPRKRKGR